MVLGALGDKVRSSGLNAMGLASLLGNEQKSFAALVPQGLLGVLGSGAATAAATGVAAKITGIGQGTHAPAPQAHAAPIATAAAHTHSHAPAAAHATTTHTVSTPAARPAAAAASPAIPHHHAASGGSRLGSLAMWWALLGLMGAGIWYWYMHSPVGLPKVAVTAPAAKVEAPAVKVEAPAPAAPKVEAPAVKVEAPKVEAPKIEAPAVKVEAPKVEAPAVKVEAPKVAAPAWSFAPSSTEGRMIEFIQDGSRAVDKTTCFDFPEITFETASAELTGAAKAQVGRINEVLKAYPAVALKIGGYTDNTGDPDRNLKLSDNRAKAVMAALVAMGAARARLEAEGYGPQFPVASNDTEEGRAKNRRISLRVTNK